MTTTDSTSFENAHARAVNFASVIRELAGAKANGDTNDEERRLWYGIEEMAETILRDVEAMRDAEVALSNKLYAIEHDPNCRDLIAHAAALRRCEVTVPHDAQESLQ